MVRDKTIYICMNHEPSIIFQTHKPTPLCPKCKSDEWVSCYSGGRSVGRSEVRGEAVKEPVPEAIAVEEVAVKPTGQMKITEGA